MKIIIKLSTNEILQVLFLRFNSTNKHLTSLVFVLKHESPIMMFYDSPTNLRLLEKGDSIILSSNGCMQEVCRISAEAMRGSFRTLILFLMSTTNQHKSFQIMIKGVNNRKSRIKKTAIMRIRRFFK